MSKFLSELVIKEFQGDENLWQLDEELVYKSDLLTDPTSSSSMSGVVVVPAGLYTDLASVPRVPFIYESWGNRAHRAAVIHDYLYRIDARPALSYSSCNAVFREAMGATGASFQIRWPMWLGVFLGGWTSYHKRSVDWQPGDDPPVCVDPNITTQP